MELSNELITRVATINDGIWAVCAASGSAPEPCTTSESVARDRYIRTPLPLPHSNNLVHDAPLEQISTQVVY